jgi:hypothetical protein
MKIKLMLPIILLLLLITPKSDARYRAFKYLIVDAVTNEEHTVISSLEPRVFINYYEANRSFRNMTVLSTWMCWGHTGYFKPICPDPRDEEAEVEAEEL